MKFRHFTPSALLLGTLVLGVAGGVGADDRKPRKSEHNAVREAMQRGELLPLVKILEIATRQVPGDVIEVELEDEKHVLVYEIKILTSTGRVREVNVDARTGTVLKIEDD